MKKRNDADWKSRLTCRFNWRKFRFDLGRWCYRTDNDGETLEVWWEWA